MRAGLTATRQSPAPRSGLLRNRDFVRLWTAESVSQLGSQVSLLALPLLAIKTLHASTLRGRRAAAPSSSRRS